MSLNAERHPEAPSDSASRRRVQGGVLCPGCPVAGFATPGEVAQVWKVTLFFFDGDRLKSLLEKAMATHSSTLAWKIPWTEDPAW